MISLVVTTWGQDTLYTRRCLDRILAWKHSDHELIVVAHDESALLGAWLAGLYVDGKIDRLIHAETGHGHVRGVNLGFRAARGDYIFNINTDVRVGPGLVDDCIAMFAENPALGLVGWHYNWAPEHEGTFWRGPDRLESTLRLTENLSRHPGFVDREHMDNIRRAPWATGRVIRAVRDRRILCSNTSFFGIPRTTWQTLGGFDEQRYPHCWADDFLCYAVLDQGLDIANLASDVRVSRQPGKFESLSDLAWSPGGEPDRDCDLLYRHDGDAVQQLEDVIARRAAGGGRVNAVGDRSRIPARLLARCGTDGGSSLTAARLADSDFVLIGGDSTPELASEVTRDLASGGAIIRYRGQRTDVHAAIVPRTCYRRDRALPEKIRAA